MISIIMRRARFLTGSTGQILLILTALCQACAYQFSQLHTQIPGGLRSVAVEAVYDTSRDIIPHELLWSAMQNQIARSGHVLLTQQEEADGLVTIWLQKSSVNPAGTASREPLAKDPPISAPSKGRPDEYRNLRRAGSWTTDESVSYTVDIVLHDLRNGKVLKRQSYSLSSNFKSLRPVTITSTSSGFLNYEEAMEARVKDLATQLAQKVVSDFSL